MRRRSSVLLVAITLAACGSSPRESEDAPAAAMEATGAATSPIARSPTTAALPSVLPNEDFQLYTHCGVNGAMIDGVWWHLTPALSDGNGNPPVGWGNPYQSGVLQFDESTAIFPETRRRNDRRREQNARSRTRANSGS
jgi:hypothetical protein